jgi:hypothetical protein
MIRHGVDRDRRLFIVVVSFFTRIRMDTATDPGGSGA